MLAYKAPVGRRNRVALFAKSEGTKPAVHFEEPGEDAEVG